MESITADRQIEKEAAEPQFIPFPNLFFCLADLYLFVTIDIFHIYIIVAFCFSKQTLLQCYAIIL